MISTSEKPCAINDSCSINTYQRDDCSIKVY